MKNFKILIIAVISIVAFSCSKDDDTPPPSNLLLGYIPSNGLVSYYTFSGNANELQKPALNGTVVTTVLSADRFSVADKAYDFNGGYIEVNQDPSFNTGNELTLSFWAKVDNITQTQKVFGIASQDPDSGIISGSFIIGFQNSKVHFEITDSNGNKPKLNEGALVSSNEWTHIAATWKTNGNMIVYINGIEDARMDATAFSLNSVDAPLIIGGSPWDQDPLYFPFKGNLDDIGIWNRAFSASEVLSLYNSSN